MKDKQLDYGTLQVSIEMSMLKIKGSGMFGKQQAKEIMKYIRENLKQIKEDK